MRKPVLFQSQWLKRSLPKNGLSKNLLVEAVYECIAGDGSRAFCKYCNLNLSVRKGFSSLSRHHSSIHHLSLLKAALNNSTPTKQGKFHVSDSNTLNQDLINVFSAYGIDVGKFKDPFALFHSSFFSIDIASHLHTVGFCIRGLLSKENEISKEDIWLCVKCTEVLITLFRQASEINQQHFEIAKCLFESLCYMLLVRDDLSKEESSTIFHVLIELGIGQKDLLKHLYNESKLNKPYTKHLPRSDVSREKLLEYLEKLEPLGAKIENSLRIAFDEMSASDEENRFTDSDFTNASSPHLSPKLSSIKNISKLNSLPVSAKCTTRPQNSKSLRSQSLPNSLVLKISKSASSSKRFSSIISHISKVRKAKFSQVKRLNSSTDSYCSTTQSTKSSPSLQSKISKHSQKCSKNKPTTESFVANKQNLIKPLNDKEEPVLSSVPTNKADLPQPKSNVNANKSSKRCRTSSLTIPRSPKKCLNSFALSLHKEEKVKTCKPKHCHIKTETLHESISNVAKPSLPEIDSNFLNSNRSPSKRSQSSCLPKIRKSKLSKKNKRFRSLPSQTNSKLIKRKRALFSRHSPRTSVLSPIRIHSMLKSSSTRISPRMSPKKLSRSKQQLSLQWSSSEIINLRKGVQMYGKNWSKILNNFQFLEARSTLGLSQKWRSLSSEYLDGKLNFS